MKRVILDTDLGCDCDDAGAMAVLHNLEKSNLCQILTISSCTSREDAARAIKIINSYYSNSELPIGVYKTGSMLNNGKHYYV